MFKHPSPADFFRTMEDASAVDLDWFWRGWFYTTDHCDVAITGVKQYKLDFARPEEGTTQKSIEKNIKKLTKQAAINPIFQAIKSSETPSETYSQLFANLTDARSELLNREGYVCQIDLEMIGGLVMPVILKLTYEDGSSSMVRIPAEIWKMQNESLQEKVNKVIVTEKKVTEVILDPYLETADTDTSNNSWSAN